MNRTLLFILLFRSLLMGQQDSVKLAWPPDRARIQHLQTISSMENLQPKKGFFAKLFGFLTGGERTPRWLVQPVGIAVSPTCDIVITDPGAHGLHVIKMSEHEYDFMAETKFGKFISPVGVAFAADGDIYVSDSQRGDVTVFNRDFDAEFQIKDSLSHPTGVKILNEKLYIADTDRHRIVVFDRKGTYLSSIGKRGAGEGEFNYPVQLAAKDSVYVLDGLNYRVQKFDFDGRFGMTFGQHGNIAGRFASPKGIALDSDGNVYVTDALMDNFQIFNPAGQLLLIVGGHGTKDGEFMSPGGIAIDSQDHIYVVETLNKRIQIFQYIK